MQQLPQLKNIIRRESVSVKDAVWLIGDGRSGTTWVSGLLNFDHYYREMFEPFHPRFVKAAERLLPNEYIRPDDSRDDIFELASPVFSGRFHHPRVDQGRFPRIFRRGLLIKDIFANLFACWAAERFPEIKIILLMRNPFAVALSKYKMSRWFWMTDPVRFLEQPKLVEDHLRPFEDVIANVGDDYIERQILIWSILYYVPLRQFRPERICTVFYENIYANPRKELARIFSYLNRYDDPTQMDIRSSILKQPSRTSKVVSNIITGKSPVTSWQHEIPSRSIERGLGILERFGMHTIYGSEARPAGQMELTIDDLRFAIDD